VESSGEPNHLEGEGLGPVIELISEDDGQIDLSQWHGLFPGHNTMKRCSGWAEVRPIDAHLVERLGVHDVEVAASVLSTLVSHFGPTIRSTTSGYLRGCGTVSR